MLTEESLKIEVLAANRQIPFNLLELADPSISNIKQYLETGMCYVTKLNSEIIGAMILNKINPTTIEIKNISIKESAQRNGFGKLLLRYAEKVSRQSEYKKLIIGTGNSSIGQIALYQKEGFEMKRIKKDFFIKNYSKPIFENGIQCKHMIILEKDLNKS